MLTIFDKYEFAYSKRHRVTCMCKTEAMSYNKSFVGRLFSVDNKFFWFEMNGGLGCVSKNSLVCLECLEKQ